MPYFIYKKIEKPLTLVHITTHDDYQKAKSLIRSLRAEDPLTDAVYRMVFAQTSGEAEKLLSTPRDDRVIGED